MKAMPSLFMMTDAKDTASPSVETPVVITQMAAAEPKPRNMKKIVIIAVSAVATVAIILTAILVGMYLYTEGTKEILKHTWDLNKGAKEDVTVDKNENVNQYHVRNVNYEMWVVDDFNRDIRVTKIQTDTETNCYVVPLNRTATADPSKIQTPAKIDVKNNETNTLHYDVSSTPISDTSFLGKTAKETCKGVSIYWLYPKCNEEGTAMQRQKRYYSCYYYCYYCYYYPYYYVCCSYYCYY